MRGHRCSTCTRVETESDTDSDSGTMRCISCKEYYGRCDAGTCKECYEEASETEEELKKRSMISKLKSPSCVSGLLSITAPLLALASPMSFWLLPPMMDFLGLLHLSQSLLIRPFWRAVPQSLRQCLRTRWKKAGVMAYDLLILAEKYEHNAKHLLESALSLITDNMDKLTKREEYMELVEKDPRLVVDIYEAYLSKQVNTAALKDSSSKKP
ncbi:hypothetical protein OIU76_001830 [Salix suchowensis]|nr:hypothetical protein OIU76_001830 [Salix suchowensis]